MKHLYRGLLGYGPPYTIEAERILEDLYADESPAFMGSKEDRQSTLELLVQAMSHAKDRQGLESALDIFLRVSRTRRIRLDIPEAGVRIDKWRWGRLRVDRTGPLEGSQVGPKSVTWKDEIGIVAAACQEWCCNELARGIPGGRRNGR